MPRLDQLIKAGRNNAICGKITTKPSRTKSAQKNGPMPLKMVQRDTSGIIVFNTNTFIPTGGVIRLISVTMMTTMPNQIRSNPKD